MEDILYSTPDYILKVGNHTDTDNLCYQIINKKYDVIEYETYLYPQAIKYTSDLQAGVDAIKDITGLKKA